MRGSKLIILTLLAVALGAFIYFVERNEPTTDERQQRADRVFPELEADQVSSVELVTSHGPVRMTRTDDDEWRLDAPIEADADPVSVRSLIQSVAALKAERELPASEVSLADLGLAEPSLSVTLVDEKGRRFALEVGAEAPLGKRRAVRRAGDDGVVMTTGAFVANLDQELDHWRSRKVVDILEHQLASIEIDAGDDEIKAVRLGERWRLLEPLEDLADGEQIRSLVADLDGLRISEFLPDGSDPAALGLEPPEYRLLLVRSDGGDPVTLELAAPTSDEGPGSLVCRRDGAEAFTVPGSIRTRLAKAPVLWRSAEVWPFATWDVARVRLTGGGDEIVLEQADGVWRLADDAGDADEVEVRRRLGALAELEAKDFDLLPPPTEITGSVTLELEGDDEEPVTYTFHAPMEDGGHAAVTVTGRTTIMGVDPTVVATIVGDLDALRAQAPEEPDGAE